MKLIRYLQKWARIYFSFTGLLFNVFAVAGALGMALGNPGLSPFSSAGLTQTPFDDLSLCSRWFSGQKVNFDRETTLQISKSKGKPEEWIVNGRRSFVSGRTKAGHWIVSAQTRPADELEGKTYNLTLETDPAYQILRCLPAPQSPQARLSECLAVAGDFENNGDCLVNVQMASDCAHMSGQLLPDRQTCRVPRSGRLLATKKSPPSNKN